jgi:hypothetical protein
MSFKTSLDSTLGTDAGELALYAIVGVTIVFALVWVENYLEQQVNNEVDAVTSSFNDALSELNPLNWFGGSSN